MLAVAVDGRALSARRLQPTQSFHFSARESIAGLKIVSILMELLDRYGADWAKVFSEFERARKENTDAIADLAVENFVEMRDRVADPRFLFRKESGTGTGGKVSEGVRAEVRDGDIPSRAVFYGAERGQVQDRMSNELCEVIERIEDLDWNKADRLVRVNWTPLEIM